MFKTSRCLDEKINLQIEYFLLVKRSLFSRVEISTDTCPQKNEKYELYLEVQYCVTCNIVDGKRIFKPITLT